MSVMSASVGLFLCVRAEWLQSLSSVKTDFRCIKNDDKL